MRIHNHTKTLSSVTWEGLGRSQSLWSSTVISRWQGKPPEICLSLLYSRWSHRR